MTVTARRTNLIPVLQCTLYFVENKEEILVHYLKCYDCNSKEKKHNNGCSIKETPVFHFPVVFK